MISLLITLVVVGVILWLINTYIPMPPMFKTVINIIAVVALIIYLLRFANLV